MSDLYNEVMLRRWSIDLATGRAECFEDAIDVTLISAEDRAAIEAKNADIRAAIEAADLVAAGEPTNDGYVDVLARLRAGQASDEDRQIIGDRYNYPLAITMPTEAELARRAMPALKPYQFRAIVELSGLEEAILAAIEALPDAVEKVVARNRYRRSDSYRRIDPMFSDLSPAVGVSPEQIDALWQWAQTL